MKEFLEQLGFEDITPNNPLDMMYYSLNEHFECDKPFHSLYRKITDNGIITFIMHSNEGDLNYINIVSKYRNKWQKAQQIAPSKYVKQITFDLLTCVEASILTL